VRKAALGGQIFRGEKENRTVKECQRRCKLLIGKKTKKQCPEKKKLRS
jgi:hypothetical protein